MKWKIFLLEKLTSCSGQWDINRKAKEFKKEAARLSKK